MAPALGLRHPQRHLSYQPRGALTLRQSTTQQDEHLQWSHRFACGLSTLPAIGYKLQSGRAVRNRLVYCLPVLCIRFRQHHVDPPRRSQAHQSKDISSLRSVVQEAGKRKRRQSEIHHQTWSRSRSRGSGESQTRVAQEGNVGQEREKRL